MSAKIHKKQEKANQEKNSVNEDTILILYNDEIHSFNYVIDCLIEVCMHSNVQAEQCTTIAHYKGVCEIKKGKLDDIRDMQMGLIEKGLKTEIK